MINFPASLKAPGSAHSGMAAVHLLDVLDVNGNAYYWSDRNINAPVVLVAGNAPGAPGFPLSVPVSLSAGQSAMWLFPQSATLSGLGSFTRSGPGMVGTVQQQYMGPFTTPNILTFSDWQPSSLPPGSVIDAIYLVINHSAWPSEGSFPMSPGAGTIGQSSVALGGGLPPIPAAFEFYNSTPPTPGTPEWIGSAFLGLDPQTLTIYSIGVVVIYHSTGSGGGSLPAGFSRYTPWILSVPNITFNRSLATDTGSFILQNLSGDTLKRDFEKIARSSALEGAMFVYRYYDPATRVAWIEHHGTFSVEGVPSDTVSLKGVALTNLAAYDTPRRQIAETCQQVIWGGPGCGATGSTECQYSFQTCQVPERFMGSLNNYEKNFGESLANVALKVINRQRRI